MKNIGAVALLLLLAACSQPESSKATIYGRVPEFSLTESGGKTVTLADLHGKVWIADFIFTSCAGTCPLMTGRMRKLQDTLPADIRLVSITVDPTRDTPAVLASYARSAGADSNRWMFLTGDRKALYDLSIKGFKLPVDDSAGSEAEPITHSSRFALVDKDGQIRGYYRGTEEDDFQRLVNDASNNK